MATLKKRKPNADSPLNVHSEYAALIMRSNGLERKIGLISSTINASGGSPGGQRARKMIKDSLAWVARFRERVKDLKADWRRSSPQTVGGRNIQLYAQSLSPHNSLPLSLLKVSAPGTKPQNSAPSTATKMSVAVHIKEGIGILATGTTSKVHVSVRLGYEWKHISGPAACKFPEWDETLSFENVRGDCSCAEILIYRDRSGAVGGAANSREALGNATIDISTLVGTVSSSAVASSVDESKNSTGDLVRLYESSSIQSPQQAIDAVRRGSFGKGDGKGTAPQRRIDARLLPNNDGEGSYVWAKLRGSSRGYIKVGFRVISEAGGPDAREVRSKYRSASMDDADRKQPYGRSFRRVKSPMGSAEAWDRVYRAMPTFLGRSDPDVQTSEDSKRLGPGFAASTSSAADETLPAPLASTPRRTPAAAASATSTTSATSATSATNPDQVLSQPVTPFKSATRAKTAPRTTPTSRIDSRLRVLREEMLVLSSSIAKGGTPVLSPAAIAAPAVPAKSQHKVISLKDVRVVRPASTGTPALFRPPCIELTSVKERERIIRSTNIKDKGKDARAKNKHGDSVALVERLTTALQMSKSPTSSAARSTKSSPAPSKEPQACGARQPLRKARVTLRMRDISHKTPGLAPLLRDDLARALGIASGRIIVKRVSSDRLQQSGRSHTTGSQALHGKKGGPRLQRYAVHSGSTAGRPSDVASQANQSVLSIFSNSQIVSGPDNSGSGLQVLAEEDPDVIDSERTLEPQPPPPSIQTRDRSSTTMARASLISIESQPDQSQLDSNSFSANVLGKAFTNVETIGLGEVSVVYRARVRRTSQMVAVRAYNRRKLTLSKMRELDTEIGIFFGHGGDEPVLQPPLHPSILGIFDYFPNVRAPSGSLSVIVSTLCSPKPLGALLMEIGSQGEDLACSIACQISSALAYLHGKGLVHRSVSTNHVLLSTRSKWSPVRLTGFGNATADSISTMHASLFDAQLSKQSQLLHLYNLSSRKNVDSCFEAPEIKRARAMKSETRRTALTSGARRLSLRRSTHGHKLPPTRFRARSTNKTPGNLKKADIFGLGAVCFAVYMGAPPRGAVDIEKVGMSGCAGDEIRRMLRVDPALRPGALDVVNCEWLATARAGVNGIVKVDQKLGLCDSNEGKISRSAWGYFRELIPDCAVRDMETALIEAGYVTVADCIKSVVRHRPTLVRPIADDAPAGSSPVPASPQRDTVWTRAPRTRPSKMRT